MGMSAWSPEYHTVDQVLSFPTDENRYELVYGELLVSPAPSLRHQLIVTRLAVLLSGYCTREKVGRALVSPADLTWGRDDVLAQPDVFVIGDQDASVQQWRDVRHVPLIAEVISPSTGHHDRFRKRALYRDRRVDVYWIVDPDAAFAEVWTPNVRFPAIEREQLTWHPERAEKALVIPLAPVFAD
ncbi:MAG: Uma2 family endonuclease [Gemmatimonadaceae bacterium]